MASGTVSVLDGLWHVEFEGSKDGLQLSMAGMGFKLALMQFFIFLGGVLVMGEG